MVQTFKNVAFPSNTYLLSHKNDRTCLIIDPGLDEIALSEKIQELDLVPIAILATHGHFDHVAGVSFLKTKYDVPFYLHEEDAKIALSVNFFLKLTRIEHKVTAPRPDHVFKGKRDNLAIAGFDIVIHNFPGHTSGSCILQHNQDLFSGDLIYKKGLGFNSFPGEDKVTLRASLLKILAAFPDDAHIFPGHGESEYLGSIKSNNFELMKFLS